MPRTRSSLTLSTVFCAALLPAHAAWAGCTEVIAAIQKADAQPRFAQYFVNSPDEAMTGDPMVVRVDGLMYTPGMSSWQADPVSPNPVLATIKTAEGKGTGKCQPAGAGKVRGTVVDKFSYTGPLMGTIAGTYTLWVDKASGLPLYHETTLVRIAGGVAWKYGNAVQAPNNVK